MIRGPTPELCCAACQQTPGCEVGILDQALQCYLKKGLTGTAPNPNVTSCRVNHPLPSPAENPLRNIPELPKYHYSWDMPQQYIDANAHDGLVVDYVSRHSTCLHPPKLSLTMHGILCRPA